jgi:hypothetical protein
MSNYQTTAGHSYRSIAESAYKSYAANTGNKNFKGDPMPEWSDLPLAIQTAWEAASRQVLLIGNNPLSSIPDEQEWQGWERP